MKSNFFVADLSGEKSDRFSDCLRDSARGNAWKIHAQTFDEQTISKTIRFFVAGGPQEKT